ncbi:hypothetical protein [Paraburkholderia atlantica]|uniref:hypothetical protein n=1 Tax=Paraburkholderia atlantica TaxID=2654982 RepID=UPI001607B149|nr:hypothetical protein [Paraburkholderia atlantica]MBB5420806.1 hypothetical protein [Paraburkholderia atlantica]
MRPQRRPQKVQLSVHLYGVLDCVYDDPPAGLPRLSPKEFKTRFVLPWRDAKYASSDEALARISRTLREAEAKDPLGAEEDRAIVENICAFVGLALHYLRRDEIEEAWSMHSLAQYSLGIRAASRADGNPLSRLASSGGFAKAAKDPKQREKAFVKDCWKDWQNDSDRYKGKAEFARDMLSKCEHLTSQKKIEDWCRTWESEIVTLPAE